MLPPKHSTDNYTTTQLYDFSGYVIQLALLCVLTIRLHRTFPTNKCGRCCIQHHGARTQHIFCYAGYDMPCRDRLLRVQQNIDVACSKQIRPSTQSLMRRTLFGSLLFIKHAQSVSLFVPMVSKNE